MALIDQVVSEKNMFENIMVIGLAVLEKNILKSFTIYIGMVAILGM